LFKPCSILLAILIALCACAGPAGSKNRPGTIGAKQAMVQKKGKKGRAPYYPTIAEQDVRKWFKTVELKGYAQVSLYNEFHPIDGCLVARFEGGKGRVLFLSFVDNKRKDPEFGIKRTAREIISVGAKGLVNRWVIKGRAWYGDDTSGPVMAVDVNKEVKLVLLGFSGLCLDDLPPLAAALKLDALAKSARK